MSVTNSHKNYPLFPNVGDYYIDPITGTSEYWDGHQWLSLSSTIQVANTQWISPATVTFNHSNGKDKVTADELIDFMALMKKRMLVITEDFEKHEKYPALKEAYEHYKLIERLCCGDE